MQSEQEQFDQPAGVIARVVVPSGAEAADAAHQLVAARAGPDLTCADGGVKQLPADGHQAVEEVRVQRLEAAAVRLQRVGESVLGDEEVNEEVDPLAERRQRRVGLGQQRRAGLGAGLDLVPEDGDDEVRPGREVAVDRPDPDTRAVAISRIGASTPEATNTAAAAASSVCSFRSASARLPRGDACADGLAVDTKPSLRNADPVRV